MKKAMRNKLAVQYKDIMFLLVINEAVPNSVIQRIAETKNANEEEYITLDSNDEITFFKGLDFVLDYNEYAIMNLEEIKVIITETKRNIAATVEKYGQMIKYDRLKSNVVLNDYEKLKYKLSNLSAISSEREIDNAVEKSKTKEKTAPFWKTRI